MKTTILLIAFICLVSLIGEAAVPIRSCGAILDRPGETYRLVRDLDCTSPAVRITANDVEFDLHRRTISGPGGTTTQAIFVDGVNGVEIHGGNINEYGTGVMFFGGAGNLVHDLVITDCNNGIWMVDALNSNALRNVITSSPGAGILVTANSATPQNNTIGENTISNSRIGITSRSHTGAQIIRNTISDSVELGMDIGQNSSGNIRENIISRSGLVGIQLQESDHLQIFNNTSNDNVNYGIALGNNLGEPPNDDNNIRGNTTNRNGIGIIIVIGTGNTLRTNTSLENTDTDMWDNFLCENSWSLNTFVTDIEGDGPGAGCVQ
jgi:parallel beta-helix repeat protein